MERAARWTVDQRLRAWQGAAMLLLLVSSFAIGWALSSRRGEGNDAPQDLKVRSLVLVDEHGNQVGLLGPADVWALHSGIAQPGRKFGLFLTGEDVQFAEPTDERVRALGDAGNLVVSGAAFGLNNKWVVSTSGVAR